MKKLLITSSLVLAAFASVSLATATGSFANAGNQRAEKMFSEMDTNSDGMISQTEITAAKSRRFHEMDVNNDSAVSSDELINHAINKMKERMQERMGKRFAKMDTDASGMISSEEFGSRASKMIEHLDTNKDGAISLQEMKDRKSKKHQQ